MAPKTNRVRVTKPTIATRAHAEDVLNEIREATIARNQAQLEMEAERLAIDEKYGPEIKDLNTHIGALSELLRGWAEANPSEFGKRRTIDLVHGTLGWRKGMPKLVKKAKETWEAMVERVKQTLGHGYIRTKDEVDRATIIRAHEDGVIDAVQLKQAGLSVVQEDGFFVEPRIEAEDNRVNAKEAAQ